VGRAAAVLVGRLATALAVAGMITIGWAPPAAAHGGDGEIEVGDAVATGELDVGFPLHITYVSDGHPAEEVDGLSVEGKGPGGATVSGAGSFVAGDAPGVYRVTVSVPVAGRWDLTVVAAEPEATATLTVEVGPPASVDEPADPGDAPDAPPDEADGDDTGGSGDDADPVGSGSDLDAVDDGVADSDDTGGIPVVALAIGLAAAVVAGVIGYRWSVGRAAPTEQARVTRRRPPSPRGGPS
jgi:hypothetical protein